MNLSRRCPAKSASPPTFTGHLLGLQSRSRFGCIALHPGDKADWADALLIGGYIDLRWLRASHVPFVVSEIRVQDDDGTVSKKLHQPLEPDSANVEGFSLLR